MFLNNGVCYKCGNVLSTGDAKGLCRICENKFYETSLHIQQYKKYTPSENQVSDDFEKDVHNAKQLFTATEPFSICENRLYEAGRILIKALIQKDKIIKSLTGT